MNVLPKECGLPLGKGVGLSIDLILGAVLIFITPCHISSTKFEQMKDQEDDLLSKGYIRLSVSP